MKLHNTAQSFGKKSVQVYYGYWYGNRGALYINPTSLHSALMRGSLFLGEAPIEQVQRFAESTTDDDLSPSTVEFLWSTFLATQ